MTVITARISDDLDNSLSSIAKSMQRSKSFIVCKAIERYVIEVQEDIEDLRGALESLKINDQTYTLEEVIQELGLKDEMEH